MQTIVGNENLARQACLDALTFRGERGFSSGATEKDTGEDAWPYLVKSAGWPFDLLH